MWPSVTSGSLALLSPQHWPPRAIVLKALTEVIASGSLPTILPFCLCLVDHILTKAWHAVGQKSDGVCCNYQGHLSAIWPLEVFDPVYYSQSSGKTLPTLAFLLLFGMRLWCLLIKLLLPLILCCCFSVFNFGLWSIFCLQIPGHIFTIIWKRIYLRIRETTRIENKRKKTAPICWCTSQNNHTRFSHLG